MKSKISSLLERVNRCLGKTFRLISTGERSKPTAQCVVPPVGVAEEGNSAPPAALAAEMLHSISSVDKAMVQAAYKLSSSTVESLKEGSDIKSELLGKGWELLRRYNPSKKRWPGRGSYGYKAVAFINRKTRVIQIATAGTELHEKWDMWDNLKLLSGRAPFLKRFVSRIPNKVEPSQDFLEDIIRDLGGHEAASGYTFNTCGHSLGAIMADLNGALIISKDLKFGRSTTFENPGSRNVVRQYILNHHLEKATNIQQQLDNACVEFNSHRNYINTSGSHLGDLYLVESRQQTIVQNKRRVRDHFGKLVQQAAKYCGVAQTRELIQDMGEQAKGHKLNNFSNLNQSNCFQVLSNWNASPGDLLVRQLPPSGSGDSMAYQSEPVIGKSMVDAHLLAPNSVVPFIQTGAALFCLGAVVLGALREAGASFTTGCASARLPEQFEYGCHFDSRTIREKWLYLDQHPIGGLGHCEGIAIQAF